MKPWTPQDIDLVRSALQRVFVSPVFAQAERQQRFLKFIVEETLAGRGEAIKGYAIGVEVFDRPADFDPTIDAIVRVEAARLRNKLREYYELAGRDETVVFALPKGAYTPVVTFVAPGTAPAAATSSNASGVIDGERPAIVVLPFVNMSSDPEQGYFADGLTEDLTTSLAQHPELMVIARQSSFVYKSSLKSAKEIGAELGVRYLLEGSVRSSSGRVRVNAQLIDANTGSHVWAEKYDRALLDLFVLQDEMTQRIAALLLEKMGVAASVERRAVKPVNLVAHDQLLRGLEQFWIYSRESNRSAQDFFWEAVRIDPRYALAHAWLARSLLFDYANNWADDAAGTLFIAVDHTQLAVSLDNGLAFAHAMRCWAEIWNRQLALAIEEGLLAVDIDLNSADAHHFLCLAYSVNGNPQLALSHIETALRLNPHPSAFYLFALGQCLLLLDRNEEAEAVLRRGTQLRSLFPPCHGYLAIPLCRLGRYAEVEEEAATVRDLWGGRNVLPDIFPSDDMKPADWNEIFDRLQVRFRKNASMGRREP